MPTRRTVLATGVALVTTGCASTRPEYQRSSDPPWCSYKAHARPFDPAEELPPDYGPAQRALAVRAIREGNATASYGPRPLKNDSYVVHDGIYHNVSVANSFAAELPALVMSVEWESGQTAPANASVYDIADLPAADRTAFRSLVYGGIYRQQVHPETRLVHSASPVPYPAGTESSVLADCDTCWVRWDGRAYRVTVHGETSTEKLVHEYTADVAAPDADAFREMIADRYLIRLEDLTPGEREIMDAAIDGRFEKRTDGRYEPFHRLWDRFPFERVPESDDQWYVEYEGERYGLDLSYACQGV